MNYSQATTFRLECPPVACCVIHVDEGEEEVEGMMVIKSIK